VNLDNGAVPPAPTVAATARRAEKGRDRARSHPGRHHRIPQDPAHVGIDKDYPHRRHMQTLVRSLSLTESRLIDEAVRRRSRFYRGREIELADDQPWILPSSGVEWEADFTRLGPDYRSLLRAVREAGDEAERRLAELALAIFLLGCNYELSPVDYQRLLVFPPGASELVEVQQEFHRLAQDHQDRLLWATLQGNAVLYLVLG
jgi:hypothetical protein